MRTIFFIISALLIFSISQAQEKFTLSGYVRDGSTGEELIGVTVLVKETAGGVVTNPYGFYSLTLPRGKYTIQFRYLGFKTEQKEIALDKNIEMNINLREELVELDDIVVTAQKENVNITDIQMSKNEINIQQIKKLPALFGEPDIIKTIQMMPGVVSAGEGNSSFFVRGGSADQNLILIDEAPIYDPSHVFGLFSVFNANAIKSSELYKGGIPSRFGGRLSSILEVRTKDGNNRKFGGNAGIGLLSANLMLEGPIKLGRLRGKDQEENSSFIISVRRSYIDLLLRAAKNAAKNKKNEIYNNTVYFYDINAKINWRPNQKNRFFLAVYSGRDDFKLEGNFGFGWGNRTATFRWNHLFSDRLFSNTSLIASNFDFELGSDEKINGFKWISNIQEYSFKKDLNYFISPKLTLDFGYHATYRRFTPGKVIPVKGSAFKAIDMQREFALEHGLYAGLQHQLTDRLTLHYGARLSVLQKIGKQTVHFYKGKLGSAKPVRTGSKDFGSFENIKTYVNPEPRLSARYLLGQASIKASYNRMVQNTHLVSGGTVPVPFNTWASSGYHLRPQIADQFALGYFRNFNDNTYEFSAETFYKDMRSVTDFADNAQLTFNQDLVTEFRQGKSRAYGLELMIQKKKGKLTGFMAYTWAKVERTIPGVNQGKTFPANHDRRNNLNLVATYEHSDKWSFGTNFTYTTGRPITLPAGSYEFGNNGARIVDIITERNGFRLAPFHRMDISATLVPRKNKGRKYKTSWVFSLYNVYSRRNPFTIYTTNTAKKGKKARLISLFPILPSVTYNIKF